MILSTVITSSPADWGVGRKSFGIGRIWSCCILWVKRKTEREKENLIQQSKAGQIVSDLRPRSLAKGILSIIRNSALPTSDEIRKSVLEYSWSNVAAAIIKEYETTINMQ
jgi:hypothetical protein